MPLEPKSVATAAAIWLLTAALLWWGRLPASWRRTLALLASGAALGFLVAAMNTEGVREAPTVAVYLGGSPYVTERASASASLPYYVLTGICLLLGTAGLAVGDETARRIGDRWMATAIVVSLLITGARFLLEKVAAPRMWTWSVGVTWLAPVVGAFFALNLRGEGKGLRHIAGALLLYGLAVRGAVASLMVVASTLKLGSHYDVSSVVRISNPITHAISEFEPGSFRQVLQLGVVPQLFFWPVYTLVAGLVGAGVAVLVLWAAQQSANSNQRSAIRLSADS